MENYGEYEVTANAPLAHDIRDISIYCPEAAQNAKAGQFAQLFVNRADLLLPRPISICEVAGDSLRFVFRVVGEGTAALAKLRPGRRVRMIAPLGVGYPLSKKGKIALVGGGLGVPPLVMLAKELKKDTPSRPIHAFLGFSGQPFLTEDFKGAIVHIATDDGIESFRGNAAELLDTYTNSDENDVDAFDVIYACGPRPMLKALANHAEQTGSRLFVSMEERMACGVGACVGCAVKTNDGHGGFIYKKVCADGPVFDSREVFWES